MKQIVALLVAGVLVLSSVAFADTYTLEEILPSVSTYTDDELQTLYDAVVEEQETRNAEKTQSEEEEKTPVDNTPYTERADYVERETVQRGDKGDNALAVQERLIELGFLAGDAGRW